MSLKEAENRVYIEGLLNEVNLEESTYTNKKTGRTMNCIRGEFSVRVEGKDKVDEIPIRVFVGQYTNNNTENPAYVNMKKVLDSYVSVAAGGLEAATPVVINKGKLGMNEYVSRVTGNIVSFPQIRASFINASTKDKLTPKAEFSVEFTIAEMAPELSKTQEETGRLKIVGIVPQYGGNVDVITFYADDPDVIEGIQNTWSEGDTVSAIGHLSFSVKTEKVTRESAFGAPEETTRTVHTSDLIITGGSAPYEEEAAFDTDDLQKALAARKAKLEDMKSQTSSKVSISKPKKKFEPNF